MATPFRGAVLWSQYIGMPHTEGLGTNLPLAAPEPSAGAPAREPAWTGLEITVLILFTAIAMGVFTLAAALAGAIGSSVGHGGGLQSSELLLVAASLIGQTAGLALGFGVMWGWLSAQRGVRFWQAIHWRRLRLETAAAVLLGGVVTMIGVTILGHLLPVPSEVPMDRLFTPRTAWLLVLYGVGIAPFFEEFFFRGLIYPTLRATFAEGVSRDELRAWRPLIRVLSALGMLACAGLQMRLRLLQPGARPSPLAMGVFLALLLLLVVPDALLLPVGGLLSQLARLRRPEVLAVAGTGILFGLMHAAQLGWAWALVLILVLVGVVLTLVRAITGSVMASWLFHCAYNGTLFVAQYFATQGFRHFPPGLR